MTPSIVYLIGVDHQVQHINENAIPAKIKLIADFSHHLLEYAQDLNVSIIAEEFSEEALIKSNATTSVSQNIAIKLNIAHKFCDPSTEQRASLGIENHKQREHFWLNCLQQEIHDKIIFICGDKHIDSFADLLKTMGFRVRIISKNWGHNFEEPPI